MSTSDIDAAMTTLQTAVKSRIEAETKFVAQIVERFKALKEELETKLNDKNLDLAEKTRNYLTDYLRRLGNAIEMLNDQNLDNSLNTDFNGGKKSRRRKGIRTTRRRKY